MLFIIINSLKKLEKKMLTFNQQIMNEIFLDTETTGLSVKDGDRIVEIACIETKNLNTNKKSFS